VKGGRGSCASCAEQVAQVASRETNLAGSFNGSVLAELWRVLNPMMRACFRWTVPLAIGAMACAPSIELGAQATGGGGRGSGTGASGAAGGSSSGNPLPCSPAAEFVYLISMDNELWSFQPDKKVFTMIGKLDCMNATAWHQSSDYVGINAIAIDRSGTAWLSLTQIGMSIYANAGWIYKLSTADASCEPMPTITLATYGTAGEWNQLTMAFATATANATSETLYVAGPALGRIDLNQKSLVPIGPFSNEPSPPQGPASLIGTGAGQLYGTFEYPSPALAQIDQGSAKILTNTPITGWPITFWGGAFYFSTWTELDAGTYSPSTVTRVDAKTMAVDPTYNVIAPVTIVLAGVSTCAPVTP
jgi:hypothetical protein